MLRFSCWFCEPSGIYSTWRSRISWLELTCFQTWLRIANSCIATWHEYMYYEAPDRFVKHAAFISFVDLDFKDGSLFRAKHAQPRFLLWELTSRGTFKRCRIRFSITAGRVGSCSVQIPGVSKASTTKCDFFAELSRINWILDSLTLVLASYKLTDVMRTAISYAGIFRPC